MNDKLRVIGSREEGLGRKTIMDRTLAIRHGVPYVHLVAFAIDVDRVRERFDESEDEVLPMGWEIFLLEHYLLTWFQGDDPKHRLLIEEACLTVLDMPPGESPLGGQLPFAVYNAIRRGVFPEELRSVFKQWKKKPDAMLEKLDVLWTAPDQQAGELARACLEVELTPPPAPPTREAWGLFVLRGDD